MRICFVSRELHPYVGGGIAPIVAAAVRALREVAEVTVVTSEDHRAEHERLVAAGDPRAVPADVRLLWVREPGEEGHGSAYSYMHGYAARVHDVLREAYGDRGPDLIEFCDYLAEGLVTIQARHTRAAWLRDTTVAVRLHTTAELCAVLDGHLVEDLPSQAVFEGERYCLRHADRILWSGGDVLETYRRYYGADALAPAVQLADAFLDEAGDDAVEDVDREPGPLRLLYLGRFERRKGVQDLVRAVLGLDREVQLTLLGGDTDTGPLGTSLRENLLLTAADDPRLRFLDPVPRHEVGALIKRHDAVVLPSLWECWPNAGREALQHNRPLLATPVGGLCAMAVPGRSGWLAEGTGVEALRCALEGLLDDPQQVAELAERRGPRAVFEELTDRGRLLAGYRELAATPPAPPVLRRPAEPPLVSFVVPYFELEEHLEATLDSVAAQTHTAWEAIVVNDGSFRPEDALVLQRVAARPGVEVLTQPNSGLGAARNFGILQARGTFVVPLDADDEVTPDFLERCLAPLLEDPDLAYVGSWVQYMTPEGEDFGGDLGGYLPVGNWSPRLMEHGNVAGVCTCVFRRSLFEEGLRYSEELTSYEDWLLMSELTAAGRFGAIVPERLFRYRVRPESMMRQVGAPRLARLAGELLAHRVERRVRWTREAAPRPVPPPAPAGGAEATLAERLAAAERANAELRAANARLAAGRLGPGGAASARQVRPPAEVGT